MQEELQSEEGLNLSDIFRSLMKRAWIIVATMLAGVIFGGGFAFFKYHNVHYYGTEVSYFVSSTGKADTSTAEGIQIYQTYQENILKQIRLYLSSEVFTRTVMKDLPEAENISYDTPEYDRFFTKIQKSVDYSYQVGLNLIKVDVSVLNDPDLAEHLLESIKAALPNAIKNLLSADQFGSTLCEQLDFNRSGLRNGGQTTKEMLKFGAIIGLAALLVVCVVVVLIDRQDNRLRDYEDIPFKFKTPVLGVVPKIETTNKTSSYKTNYSGKNTDQGASK